MPRVDSNIVRLRIHNRIRKRLSGNAWDAQAQQLQVAPQGMRRGELHNATTTAIALRLDNELLRFQGPYQFFPVRPHPLV